MHAYHTLNTTTDGQQADMHHSQPMQSYTKLRHNKRGTTISRNCHPLSLVYLCTMGTDDLILGVGEKAMQDRGMTSEQTTDGI